MIRLDFSELSIFERTRRWLAAVLPLAAEPAPAALLGAILLLGAVCIIETSRWEAATQRARALERGAVETAARLAAVEKRARALGAAQRRLVEALALRRANAQRAGEIAAIGNALPQTLALTTIRADSRSLQVEGRTRSVSDVQAALDSLRHIAMAAATELVELHREERTDSVVSFTLEVRR
ncbi:MAG: PilN domain-containing protein [Candidatus Eremiobacteraeota bacterium]|nr:PilN domain-containing protein [Candidatus Eremiobacteraeota bacterium]MBV8353717.1 PilN domain-containing protein [Candidatus Eremiobacteraeota bacterium]